MNPCLKNNNIYYPHLKNGPQIVSSFYRDSHRLAINQKGNIMYLIKNGLTFLNQHSPTPEISGMQIPGMSFNWVVRRHQS